MCSQIDLKVADASIALVLSIFGATNSYVLCSLFKMSVPYH
jgi:hypothetical protein